MDAFKTVKGSEYVKAEELLDYADMLFKTALSKTHDVDKAQELLQETCLCVLSSIRKGKNITNLKAYLLSTLNNRFFNSLREKYNISTVSFDELPYEIVDESDNFETMIDDESVKIRRELAFLTHIYREVMVRYYMQNESVESIAKALNIPKGTVLSRLDVGRKKVKKGVEIMKSFEKNSFTPEILSIGINGRMGQNGEPFSCVKGSLEQNILILAYEESLTVEEISNALGTPTAFIEESVESLVNNELLKREGTKVFTDFVIFSLEQRIKDVANSVQYAKETFDEAKHIFLNMVEQYKKMDCFKDCSDEWLFILAVLSSNQVFVWRLNKAILEKVMTFNDFPDRPNFGKWVTSGSKWPNGFKFDGEMSEYAVSGRATIDDVSETIKRTCEWDTFIGHTHQVKYKYTISEKERAIAIDAICAGTATAFQAEFTPDFEKYGFIKTVDGKKVANIPIMNTGEEAQFYEIEKTAGEEYANVFLEKAVKVCKDNKIKYPKRIEIAPSYIYSLSVFDYPMAYVYEANKKDVINLEKDKNYPIMYILKK